MMKLRGFISIILALALTLTLTPLTAWAAPALTKGDAERTSATEFTFSFTSTEAGTFYYQVATSGTTINPDPGDVILHAGDYDFQEWPPDSGNYYGNGDMIAGVNTKTVTVPGVDANDTFIVFVEAVETDVPGNSNMLKFEIKAYIPVNGKTPYEILQEAALAGGTYTLTEDISANDQQLTVGANFTLDLNGHTLEIHVSKNQGPFMDCIKIKNNATLVIQDSNSGQGTGKLNVSNSGDSGSYAGGGGAGINTTEGSLIIHRGTITAKGGLNAAAIGGAWDGNGGNITINGGTVSASNTIGGTGIGGSLIGNCGNITINGGTVYAVGSLGCPGIGGSDYSGSGGKITINGGTVNASSDNGGAGIGGGGNTITITGGTVGAVGGSSIGTNMGSGAGIGGGAGCIGNTITISGGTVVAKGGKCDREGGGAAGIGGGTFQTVAPGSGAGGVVAISGGTVTATAGDSNVPAIGPGYGGTPGTVTVTGTYKYTSSTDADVTGKVLYSVTVTLNNEWNNDWYNYSYIRLESTDAPSDPDNNNGGGNSGGGDSSGNQSGGPIVTETPPVTVSTFSLLGPIINAQAGVIVTSGIYTVNPHDKTITIRYGGTVIIDDLARQLAINHGYSFVIDSTGSPIQVRHTLRDLEKFNGELVIYGAVKGPAVDRTQRIFDKFFTGKKLVVHIAQQEDWGAPVRIAARLDLAGWDTDDLHFYAYDRAANKYRRITSPNPYYDKNGFLHFTTEYAGDIIISEGALSRR